MCTSHFILSDILKCGLKNGDCSNLIIFNITIWIFFSETCFSILQLNDGEEYNNCYCCLVKQPPFLLSLPQSKCHHSEKDRGFPGRAVVTNLPSNDRGCESSLCWGTRIPHATGQLLSPYTLERSLCNQRKPQYLNEDPVQPK